MADLLLRNSETAKSAALLMTEQPIIDAVRGKLSYCGKSVPTLMFGQNYKSILVVLTIIVILVVIVSIVKKNTESITNNDDFCLPGYTWVAQKLSCLPNQSVLFL